ncbi:hypothetical protein PTSG_02980 [Salpingoeca rosetta]|uniref:Uncharacterized protein n=1 Tax=Salpingoeca rosetta (strain ATCC 50818 / BSB-021) TaxID=946362 RepID=F2U3W9_SALR5|nr:uncharacterized protein PTSG_02980 [Salpingoeca rosetta]EGD82313.1 hypothetical protein PTSG_02980 [Salpingoeca rosetta]|eukprot:XP_004996496.1 hypothetical protein PTSG_02980 [Salpingoeca rosetta]
MLTCRDRAGIEALQRQVLAAGKRVLIARFGGLDGGAGWRKEISPIITAYVKQRPRLGSLLLAVALKSKVLQPDDIEPDALQALFSMMSDRQVDVTTRRHMAYAADEVASQAPPLLLNAVLKDGDLQELVVEALLHHANSVTCGFLFDVCLFVFNVCRAVCGFESTGARRWFRDLPFTLKLAGYRAQDNDVIVTAVMLLVRAAVEFMDAVADVPDHLAKLLVQHSGWTRPRSVSNLLSAIVLAQMLLKLSDVSEADARAFLSRLAAFTPSQHARQIMLVVQHVHAATSPQDVQPLFGMLALQFAAMSKQQTSQFLLCRSYPHDMVLGQRLVDADLRRLAVQAGSRYLLAQDAPGCDTDATLLLLADVTPEADVDNMVRTRVTRIEAVLTNTDGDREAGGGMAAAVDDMLLLLRDLVACSSHLSYEVACATVDVLWTAAQLHAQASELMVLAVRGLTYLAKSSTHVAERMRHRDVVAGALAAARRGVSQNTLQGKAMLAHALGLVSAICASDPAHYASMLDCHEGASGVGMLLQIARNDTGKCWASALGLLKDLLYTPARAEVLRVHRRMCLEAMLAIVSSKRVTPKMTIQQDTRIGAKHLSPASYIADILTELLLSVDEEEKEKKEEEEKKEKSGDERLARENTTHVVEVAVSRPLLALLVHRAREMRLLGAGTQRTARVLRALEILVGMRGNALEFVWGTPDAAGPGDAPANGPQDSDSDCFGDLLDELAECLASEGQTHTVAWCRLMGVVMRTMESNLEPLRLALRRHVSRNAERFASSTRGSGMKFLLSVFKDALKRCGCRTYDNDAVVVDTRARLQALIKDLTQEVRRS